MAVAAQVPLRVASQLRTAKAAGSASARAWSSALAFTRRVCSSNGSSDGGSGGGGGSNGSGSGRQRRTKPCLKELALQECNVCKASDTKWEHPPVLQALPAFVRKFVLRHPSAAQVLCDFDQVHMMLLQSPLATERQAGPGAAAAAAAAAAAPRPSQLLAALTPHQRAAAHVCRVGDTDFYLLAFACAEVLGKYDCAPSSVPLLHVPRALRGHGLGAAMLDRLVAGVFDAHPAIPLSVVDSLEHWG
ncbi:hypothetical protein ABPG75_008404 [Micractinium tetrahymenae]